MLKLLKPDVPVVRKNFSVIVKENRKEEIMFKIERLYPLFPSFPFFGSSLILVCAIKHLVSNDFAV